MTPFGANEVASSTNLVDRALAAGIEAARKGEKALARRLLQKATEMDPAREEGWLWLSVVAKTAQDAEAYLRTVLALNPGNQRAQEGLRWVKRQASPQVEAALCAKCFNLVPSGRSACPVCGTLASAEAEAPVQEARLAVEATPALSSTGELTPSFVLSVEQAEAIDACLERMAYESEARSIILADVTGQLIAERGIMGSMNTQVLSALAAGELAATHEMARLVGEKARFKLLLHEGEKQSVYLSDVGEQLILVIVFDNDTPIGLVRMVLKLAVEELTPILLHRSQGAGAVAVNETLGDDFAQLLESELDTSLEL